jgi:flagellar biosynthetic protein FlhB
MSDSDQDKTEAATPKRRQEAFDEGRIARSPELGAAALFLGAGLTINAAAPAAAQRVMELFGSGLRSMGDGPTTPGAAIALLQATGRETLVTITMLGAGLSGIALSVGALQARGVLTMTPLEPKWERLNPIANAGRMFSVQPLADLVKSVLKMAIIGWAVWHVLSAAWPDLIDLADRDPLSLLETVRRYAVKLFTTAGLSYIVLAAGDYAFQFWQYLKQMRMTKDEVKQESKASDGDPMLKGRMRAIARSRLRKQMLADVPKADVVIVNPTHIAIALKYDPMRFPAPVVLAMGERLVAERIKKLAYEHKVPVLQNKPLARALLATAKVGTMIPAELYAAVAEVLAFVLRQRAQRGERTSWSTGENE